MDINRFTLVVFFRKKFSRAESCAEDELFLIYLELILLFATCGFVGYSHNNDFCLQKFI